MPVLEEAAHNGSLWPGTAANAFRTQAASDTWEASGGRQRCPAGPAHSWNPPQSAHTCGVQEPLVHVVGEEAEQAVGPGHPSLQLLVGDRLIRVPVLHLAAEARRKAAQKQGSPQGPPGSQRPPRAVAPFPSGNTAFCSLWPQAAWGWLRRVRVRRVAASKLSSEGG